MGTNTQKGSGLFSEAKSKDLPHFSQELPCGRVPSCDEIIADNGNCGLATLVETKPAARPSSELERVPTSTVELNDAQVEEVMNLVTKLEEEDDVQNVYHNLK